jgi:hypothetical protein
MNVYDDISAGGPTQIGKKPNSLAFRQIVGNPRLISRALLVSSVVLYILFSIIFNHGCDRETPRNYRALQGVAGNTRVCGLRPHDIRDDVCPPTCFTSTELTVQVQS